MPAQIPVGLSNGTTDETYLPDGRDDKFNHVWNFRKDHPDGYAIGAERLSVSLREMPDGGMRWRAILEIPRVAVETINGVDQPKLLGKSIVQEINRYFPKDSSEAERLKAAHKLADVATVVPHVDTGNIATMWLNNQQMW